MSVEANLIMRLNSHIDAHVKGDKKGKLSFTRCSPPLCANERRSLRSESGTGVGSFWDCSFGLLGVSSSCLCLACFLGTSFSFVIFCVGGGCGSESRGLSESGGDCSLCFTLGDTDAETPKI